VNRGMSTGLRLTHDRSCVQPLKARSSMEVTLSGMVMDVRATHFRKAPIPMEVTLLGMVMDVRALHPQKVQLPM
jgi:hypothetical protein